LQQQSKKTPLSGFSRNSRPPQRGQHTEELASPARPARSGVPPPYCSFLEKLIFPIPFKPERSFPKVTNFVGYIVLSASLPFNRLGVNGCFCGVNSGKKDAFLVYNKNKEVSINIKAAQCGSPGKERL